MRNLNSDAEVIVDYTHAIFEPSSSAMVTQVSNPALKDVNSVTSKDDTEPGHNSADETDVAGHSHETESGQSSSVSESGSDEPSVLESTYAIPREVPSESAVRRETSEDHNEEISEIASVQPGLIHARGESSTAGLPAQEVDEGMGSIQPPPTVPRLTIEDSGYRQWLAKYLEPFESKTFGPEIKTGSNRSNGVILYNLLGGRWNWRDSALDFMRRMALAHLTCDWDLCGPDTTRKIDNGEDNDYCIVLFKSNDPADALRLVQMNKADPDEFIRVELMSGHYVAANDFRRLGISTVGWIMSAALKRLFANELRCKGIAIVGKPFTMRSAPDKLWVILRNGSRDSVARIQQMVTFKFAEPISDFKILPMRTQVPLHPFHCVLRNCRNKVDIELLQRHTLALLSSMDCPDEFEFSFFQDNDDGWHFAVRSWLSTRCI